MAFLALWKGAKSVDPTQISVREWLLNEVRSNADEPEEQSTTSPGPTAEAAP